MSIKYHNPADMPERFHSEFAPLLAYIRLVPYGQLPGDELKNQQRAAELIERLRAQCGEPWLYALNDMLRIVDEQATEVANFNFGG